MIIVLATDGSDFALIAEELVATLHCSEEAEIHVVSVAQPLPISVGAVHDPEELADCDELTLAWHTIKESVRQTADSASARLKARNINSTSAMLEGDASGAILDYAKQHGANLIAVGSRGAGGFISRLLGSVARRIVAYAPCSVLVAHCPDDGDPRTYAKTIADKPKLDVLVAADGSAGSNQAIDELATYDGFNRGIALCVETIATLPTGMNPAEFGSVYRYDRDRSEAVAQHGAERLAKCCDSVFHLVELGRPAHVMIEQAKVNNVDLICLGATRHGFIERFLLGSVSMEVATEAECAVLVVRVKSS